MRINTNMAALNAWRSMSSNNSNMTKSLEKLSSGYRINRAADDAAGLAVSEKMRAQIKGTNQAVKNSQDGISLLQTAEGALTETHSMLQRMRELAVQSSTSTLQDSDRSLLQEEFSQLQSEISRLGGATKFNGRNLLNGSAGVSVTASNSTITNLSGTGDTQSGTFSLTASTLATADTFTTSATFAATGTTVAAASTIMVNGTSYSFDATKTVQNVLDTINADTTSTGVQATFTAAAGITLSTTLKGSAAVMSLSGGAGSWGTSTTVIEGINATVTLSNSANYVSEGNVISITNGAYKGVSFTLDSASTATVSVGTNESLSIQTGSEAGQTLRIGIGDMRASALGVSTLSIGSQSSSSSAITSVDTAINTVSTQRAKLGAFQNRLEYTVSSLSTTAENLSAAESRIRDVDMASEMANFTKWQILSQASTAMLAQANQSTQGVLSLLR